MVAGMLSALADIGGGDVHITLSDQISRPLIGRSGVLAEKFVGEIGKQRVNRRIISKCNEQIVPVLGKVESAT